MTIQEDISTICMSFAQEVRNEDDCVLFSMQINGFELSVMIYSEEDCFDVRGILHIEAHGFEKVLEVLETIPARFKNEYCIFEGDGIGIAVRPDDYCLVDVMDSISVLIQRAHMIVAIITDDNAFGQICACE